MLRMYLIHSPLPTSARSARFPHRFLAKAAHPEAHEELKGSRTHPCFPFDHSNSSERKSKGHPKSDAKVKTEPHIN